ncbi:fungal-specific transcription factor domain-containing protein [Mycena epipterygia]|nr:fungal-specific transcription factor domain-containing protein [Mycena epipterygia]
MHEPTEDDSVRSGANGKRRRLPGACDICRRRKVRCDSAQLGGQRCTNCVSNRAECTHARLQGAENKASQERYAPALKTGREHVESILSTSVVYIPSNDPTASHRMLVEVAQYARSLEEQLAALTDPPPTTHLPTESLSSDTAPIADRYLGKSSTNQFVKSAVKHMHQNSSYVTSIQRPELWTTAPQPWEKLTTQRPQHLFPDDDLLHSLVKIYLEQINPLSGILHLPSFRDALADGLHVRDPDFGAVVLVVCASASRYSTDPRVFLEGASEYSCGWKWFRQVQPLRTSFSLVPSLYQLQLICLSVLYLAGMSRPEECWILVGLGIRAAQAAGAHHRSGYARMRVAPLEAEQYKRVYWILVITDAFMSSFQGRPAIAGGTDVDLDFPIECDSDDHYGGSPDAVQSPRTTRTSAFLGAFLRLALIFERIQGAVYPRDGRTCSLDIVADLIAALNGWVELIPEHLLWDPCQENQIFLDQSVILYTTYYHAQILIHRPFIQAPGKAPVSDVRRSSALRTSPRSPSAPMPRACSRVMDLHARRGRGLLPLANVMIALFDSAIMILINVWAVVGPGGPRVRTPEDFNRATADAQNCVRVLRLYERRFRVARRNCDIISVLLNLGKTSADGSGLKRPREPQPDDLALDVFPPSTSQHPPTASSSILPVEEATSASSSILPVEEATPASSGILSVEDEIQALQISMLEMDPLFALPLHTEEFGRLPVYDSFDYDAAFGAGGGPLQLGIPDLYRDAFEPGMHYGHDIVSMADFGMLQDGLEGAGREQMQVAPQSFDIPSGNGWGDWCANLASVDGLGQGPF